MAPLPRPLLGLILLANSLLLPGSVQGVPLEAHTPAQSWNVTTPSNSSHLVPRPTKPWAPAPFFWNAAPPRPYHEYGYGGFYHPGKGQDDERGSSYAVIDQDSESEEVVEEENSDGDDGEIDNADEDVSSPDPEESEEPDDREENSRPDFSSFWSPFTGSRRNGDRKHEHWNWK